MITAENLSARIGNRPILHDLSFRAVSGRLTAIVGPNGSGKTTLLRALSGELRITGGVLFNGMSLSDMSPTEMATCRAVLPQATTITFPFTVLELVRLGLCSGVAMAKGDYQSLPLQALARVGLQGYEGRLVQELSGGERQRAQLARVLVQIWEPVMNGVPRWLFLDEPVAALDIGHQLQIMELARRYASDGGGVIAVMHDLNLTSMFADHILLMDKGRIRASGTPNEVLTDQSLSACYGCPLRINTPPTSTRPWILPQAGISH